MVAVAGRQAARYYVEVRAGEVRVATRDGQPLRQERTRGTWSVPGMFGTIQTDIANLEKQQAGTADPTTPQLLLRGVFDPQLGYPVRYLRTELRKWGNNLEVSWEANLEVVGPSSEEESGSGQARAATGPISAASGLSRRTG
jgi:hypothetical protein